MAQVLARAEFAEADAYVPYPFAADQQVAVQWLQTYVPIFGTIAAAVHTYYYGLAFGTLAVTLLIGTAAALGVTVGFHRLFTHRSFETTPRVRNVLAVLGSMGCQNSLFVWVSAHRRHHQFSDHHGDPHSPNMDDSSFLGRARALYHAHFGWVLSDELSEDRLRYIPDLTADPTLCRIQRLYFVWIGISLILPALACYAIAGTMHAAIGGFLWGGFVRILVSTQVSCAINSVCHVWGSRPYDSHDLSRNNLTMALLAMGEGWHNNHHAFPTSARHGLNWRQPDFSWTVIKLLRRFGLVWNVKTPTAEQIDAKARVAAPG